MASRRNKFPWGLILLGVGGYLLYERSKQSATPGGSTATSPVPTTGPAALPVSSQTTATLQQTSTRSPYVGTPNYQTVYSWALREGQPQVMAWLETIPADDLAKFAYVTQMWTQYSYCKDPTCLDYWHQIKTKYPTVFAYKNYW